MKQALKECIKAMHKLDEEWDNYQVKNYPKYLPSFDEFVVEFSGILEDKTMKKTLLEALNYLDEKADLATETTEEKEEQSKSYTLLADFIESKKEIEDELIDFIENQIKQKNYTTSKTNRQKYPRISF